MLHPVAVDLGASSGRVMRGTYDGERLTIEEVHRFSNGPVAVSERLYWPIYQLFSDIKQGLMLSAKNHLVASVGIDSWAVDYGLIDGKGFLMDGVRHYRDPRNDAAMEKVVERFGREALFSRSGLQFLTFNSVYQLAATQAENPELLERAAHFLLIPDLFNYFLTGELRAEFSNATTTQLVHATSRSWDDEWLDQLGIPHHIFPQVVQPGTILSPMIDSELRHVQGLVNAKVVHTTSHDTASAVMAVPASSRRTAYLSSGTWSLLGTLVDEPVLSPTACRFNFTNEGGFGDYRLLKNIMGLWLLQETLRVQQEEGHSITVTDLLAEAEQALPLQRFFDPDDPRLLHRGDIPAHIRDMCRETGQAAPEALGELVRAILENLALKYRFVLDQMEQLTGESIDVVHIVGGGSQNRLLNQFTANATGRRVVAGPVEASALGNIAVQLLAMGELGSRAQLQELIRKSVQTVEYMPQDEAIWRDAYGRFCSVLQSAN